MSNFFMLDTDMASYLIKGIAPKVDARLRTLDVMQVCISAVTHAELRFGVRRLARATRLKGEIERFLSGVHTLAWDEAAADHFADVRVGLVRSGVPIGRMDTMIAAHAISINAILVTNNTRHFQLVAGLKFENWSV